MFRNKFVRLKSIIRQILINTFCKAFDIIVTIHINILATVIMNSFPIILWRVITHFTICLNHKA